MQCNRCGSPLPQGAAFCPNCANPTPYNIGTSGADQGLSEFDQTQMAEHTPLAIEPTQRADQEPSAVEPTQRASNEASDLAPTQMAEPPQAMVEPTQMASEAYPPMERTQLAGGPYASPPPSVGQSNPSYPPVTPAYPPVSPSAPNYSPLGQSGPNYPPLGQSGPNYPPVTPSYVPQGQAQAGWQGYPPVGQSQPGYPPYPPPGQSGPGWQQISPPMPIYTQPPRKSSATPAVIILTVLLILVCVCGILGGGAWYIQTQHANATATAQNDDANTTAIAQNDGATATADAATATADQATAEAQLTPTPYPPYTESNPPSGATFSGAAQQIITSAQMASAINDQDEPTELQSVFQPEQTVYLAYHWINPGISGYVYSIWYFDGQNIGDYTSDLLTTSYAYYNGYIYDKFPQDGQGAIEVYWCTQQDCSDKQLAWVRPFSIQG